MSIRFIHTADWQLGKPFGKFDDGLSEVLRRARLDVISRLADLAKQHDVEHVIVAGDVWDQEFPSDATIKQPLDIMKAAGHVSWWLLPGNHDPARDGGLWTRIESLGLPGNVKPLLSPEPVVMENGTFLLPAPWISKNPGLDNTLWMDTAEVPGGAIKIGIAHGSVTDFPGDSGQKCVINPFDRIKTAGLDYLALGDWHGQVSINERVGYSGTPEIDSFPDNDPGWALLVEIGGAGQVPAVTPLRTTSHMWIKKRFDVLPGQNPADLIDALKDDNIALHQTLVQAVFTGSLPTAEYLALKEYVNSVTASYAYFAADFSGLEPAFSADDLDDLDLAGSLRQCAETLIDIKEDDSLAAKETQDAGRALDLLLTFSNQVSGS